MKALSSPELVGRQLVVELADRSYPIHVVDGPVTTPHTHANFWIDLLAMSLISTRI